MCALGACVCVCVFFVGGGGMRAQEAPNAV